MEDLEKRNRVLEKKLQRSERHRATLERLRDKDHFMYEKLLAELREARASLEASNDELRRTQGQLVQQEKMASLGRLTAGIAHEIKNPLNFVNNFAGLSAELLAELRQALEAGDAEEAGTLLADLAFNAERIEAHGRRADAIVRAMMEHASGGSGQREATGLNELVAEYVDLAYHGKRARTPDFHAEVVREFGEEVGEVDVVPQEIGRVVLNLLGNAFDAVSERQRGHRPAPSGETRAPDSGRLMSEANKPPRNDYIPRVRVTTRRTSGHVQIRVSDNGPGIPKQVRDKIFEPFFTTKPVGSGTGLGLSLSYDIVTQGHGGSLTLESEDGKGATFVVTLPG